MSSENRFQRRSATTDSYYFNLSVHIEEIHSKVSLAKRRETRKITGGNIVPNIRGLQSLGKLTFSAVEVVKINLALLAFF